MGHAEIGISVSAPVEDGALTFFVFVIEEVWRTCPVSAGSDFHSL